jgi:4-amino-4-deoxy-L-arabinose transferase-like glycosyltransferase
MKFFRQYWILIIVFALALFLRVFSLTSAPPSISWDEAALGYNAYSILHTARDEHGAFLPLIFKSFGDFKPGLYVYLTAPFVAIFGLSEIAVRAPAAIFGALSSIVLFFLARRMFGNFWVAVAASFSLALSPWHLILSRPAFEAGVAMFFTLLAFLFFFKACDGKKWLFLPSAFSLVLALYTYQTAKITIPLFVLALAFVFREKIFSPGAKWIAGFLIVLFLSSPLYFGFLWGQGGGRFTIMSLFSYPRSEEETQQILSEDRLRRDSFLFQAWHGDWFYFLTGSLSRYLNHYSPSFLFFKGDVDQNPRHAVPNMGLLYYLDILFLLAGAFAFIRLKNTPAKTFLILWFLIGPVPAALTRDQTQAVRSLMLLPALQILIGFGIFTVFSYLKTLAKPVFLTLVFLFGLFFLWNFLYFADQYFLHMPKKFSQEWLYGYKEAFSFLAQNQDKYDKVVVTDKYGQPYIYYLFYRNYDPRQYQKKVNFVPNPYGDVGKVPSLDKIEFREIYWPSDRDLKNTLFIGTSFELPEKDLERDTNLGTSKILREVKFLNDQTAFKIVETK